MSIDSLLPNPKLLELMSLVSGTNLITIKLGSIQAEGKCAACHVGSNKIHSRYVRRLMDLPWHGTAIELEPQVKKFFCTNTCRARKIFTERLPGVVPPYGRKTERAWEWLWLIAFCQGGEPGGRTSKRLRIATSADTLLRRIQQQKEAKFETPRVLGVDDFAFRKGKTYGTLLVDLEKQIPIEVPPDRQKETLSAWLQQHPGVEVISRDRACSYADAAREGAPDAIQVADRWHLLKNLTEMMNRFLFCHRATLSQALFPSATEVLPESALRNLHAYTMSARARKESARKREHRLVRYQEVIHLHQQGVPNTQISRQMGLNRQPVIKSIRSQPFPEQAIRPAVPKLLDPFEAYLRKRWEAGCRNAAQLYREIQDLGFTGKPRLLRHLTAHWSQENTSPSRKTPDLESVSPRQTAFLLTQDPDQLEVEQRLYVQRLTQLSPEIAQQAHWARRFRQMILDRQPESFDSWLQEPQEKGTEEIKNFARKLKEDKQAVAAAMSSPWSNGQVEGQVNRVKMIKRARYGRAHFDLLRKRILHQTP